MKIDAYIVFDDNIRAEEFLGILNKRLGEIWAHPNIHPFDGRAIVPWSYSYLVSHAQMLEAKPILSRYEVINEGWNLGYHKGHHAKAIAKLEDALAGRDALNFFDNYPNFPAYRSIFYGILTSLYGVKEALRYSSSKIGGEAKAWWDAKFKIIKSDSRLSFFYNLHDKDKHSLDEDSLHPRVSFFGYTGSAPDIISGEGVFSLISQGTKDERRIFTPGAKASLSVYLVKEEGISEVLAKHELDIIIEFYKELVWEARQKFK